MLSKAKPVVRLSPGSTMSYGSDRDNWVVRYTTAVPDYDWPAYTEDLGVAGYDAATRKPWRKVRIDPKQVDAQVARYLSGMKPGIPQAEFNKLIEFALVVKE